MFRIGKEFCRRRLLSCLGFDLDLGCSRNFSEQSFLTGFLHFFCSYTNQSQHNILGNGLIIEEIEIMDEFLYIFSVLYMHITHYLPPVMHITTKNVYSAPTFFKIRAHASSVLPVV